MIIKIIILLCLFSAPVWAVDTDVEFQEQLDQLQSKVDLISRGQLNYQIEKDLLKETYSNNFDKINFFITILLGVFGVIGFVGIRDISQIKKEYKEELGELKETKDKFELQANEFDKNKQKIDEDLKNILNENKQQNEKIKLLELKEKLVSMVRDNNLSFALEFANAALEIKPEDTEVLNIKGSILIRLNDIPSALNIFKNCLELIPSDKTTTFNYVECLYFNGQINEAKRIVEQNKGMFAELSDGKVLELFDLIELYHQEDIEPLKAKAESYVDYENLNTFKVYIERWNLDDFKSMIFYSKEREVKKVMNCILLYWEGKITGLKLLTELNIPLKK